MTLQDAAHTEHPGGGSAMAEVSNAMVLIYKEQLGRGPTRAHSVYATPDLVISTLGQTMTVAERRLAEQGEHLRLQETRLFFQRAFQDRFVTAVEQITGRSVRAFVSGLDSENDVATEVFYLHPADGTAL